MASIWLTSLEAGVDRGASCARIILDVAIKPRVSPTHPIGGIVVINPRPCAHEAEEDVLRGPDDDPHMSVPNDQVAGLRMFDLLKSLDSVVEIIRTGVDIGKSGAFVDRMYQVRAVVSCIAAHFRIERSRDHAETIVLTERLSFPAALGACALRLRSPGRASCLLRRTNVESKSAKQRHDHPSCRNSHRPSLMPNVRPGEITLVHWPG